jgi:hypothetical protein
VTQPWPGEPVMTEDSDGDSGTAAHRPWRAIVAAAEVLVAALLVFAAQSLWSRGITSIQLLAPDGTTDVVTRLVGSWLTAAIGAGTLAGLLLVDAIRQVLAVRRGRRGTARTVPLSTSG